MLTQHVASPSIPQYLILPQHTQHSQTVSITSDVETISSDTSSEWLGRRCRCIQFADTQSAWLHARNIWKRDELSLNSDVLILFLGVSIVTRLTGVSGGFKRTCMLLRGIIFSMGILVFMNCKPWLASDSCSFLPMSFWFEIGARWFSSFSIHN